MNGRTRSVMLPCFLVLPLAAQQPAAKPAARPTTKPAATEAVDPRVQRMREQIRDGKEIRSHVRVTVRLKNGNRMQGVVKDIRLVERIDGVRFAKAEADDDGAGVRLWYSDGRNNYVFLPFADLQDYKVQEKLSSVQLREIEAKVVAAAAAAMPAATPTDPAATPLVPPVDGSTSPPAVPPGATAEVPTDGGAARVAPTDAPGTPPASGAGDAKGAANGGLDESQKKLFALLQEFPPAAGWDQKRRDEIARRKAVVGSTPSAAEQKFVDQFASWQQACELFGVEPAKEPEPAVEDTGKRSKRK
ncbi:MAG: hypothetical protein IPK26_06000 [Planctomycetes bacterium]|nr:hypothetical protein [Planctomycetota bacterium]